MGAVTPDVLLAALVGVPAAGAAILALPGLVPGGRRLAGAVAVGAAAVTAALGLAAAVSEPATAWGWGGALRLELAVLGFGRVMVVLVPLVGSAVLAYAAAEEARRGLLRLLSLLCLFLAGMELLVLAADLLTLLMGFEIVGACSWGLIAHEWRDPDVAPAADHAFLATRLGDLGLFVAAGAAWAGAGTFSFGALGSLPAGSLHAVAGGVLLAAAAKSAQVPFAPWLFSAMRGPTPVSALLHSATMVAAGAYVLVRLAPALGEVGWFGPAAIGVGLATAVAGGVVASLHDHVKKALAASTSAHYGLMLVAVGAGSAAAGAVHLVTHAAFKSLLFLGAGVAIHAAGSEELREMRLGRALPRAAVLFGVGAAALAAVPPLGGAFSKEEVVKAAAHHGTWLGLAVIAAGFLSAFYAARLHLLAFGRGRGGRDVRRRPSAGALAGMGLLAAASLLLGLLWLPGAGHRVEEVVGGGIPPGAAWELLASWLAVALALGIAWNLRRGGLARLGLREADRRRAADWLGLPAATRRLVTAPTLRLAEALAAVDERVVDAGVRLVARTADAFSGFLAFLAERGVDGMVWAVARGTEGAALVSRRADDRGVDGAVEGTARGVGAGGRAGRRVQTGRLPSYYVILAAGVMVAFLTLFFWR